MAAGGCKSPANSPKPLVKSSQSEWFYQELMTHYLQEYIQYLQTLNFMTIDPKAMGTKRSKTSQESLLHPVTKMRRRNKTGFSHVRYLQKSLLGGLLICEIGVCEPFFYTKLHALEASRIHLKGSLAPPGKTFKSTFIDECDRTKILIHLHSYTYDYHLRTVHNYIAQKIPSNLRKGFHLTSFLEDFMKWYNKCPNYARNLIHSGLIHVSSQMVTPQQVFNYLLSHEKHYKMNVIR